MVLEMLFLKISNIDVEFGKKTITWKSYIINKALQITNQVQLVDPKKFIIAALDADSETFIVHITIQKREEMTIDPDKKAQIEARSGA